MNRAEERARHLRDQEEQDLRRTSMIQEGTAVFKRRSSRAPRDASFGRANGDGATWPRQGADLARAALRLAR
eukprot:3283289-Pyramimonas_sp.AAC.1